MTEEEIDNFENYDQRAEATLAYRLIWHSTVETRLSELRTDMRNLLIGGAVVALALGGVWWGVYNSTNTRLENMAVSQKEIQGKIETLDAKLSGRIDMLDQRLGDNHH